MMRNLPPCHSSNKPRRVERKIHFIRRSFIRSSVVLTHLRNACFSLLFPWKCPCCAMLLPYPQVLCESCIGSLKKIQAPFCKRCGNPFPGHWRVAVCADCMSSRSALTKTRSAFFYEGLVKQMIRDAKYSRKVRLLRHFAEELFVLARMEFPATIEALIPVPLHRSREWSRTFNQAEFLAKEMSRLMGTRVTKVLIKKRKTTPQSSLSGMSRRANLRGAFDCKLMPPLPKSVLLVDDVLTTGTTLEECARMLRRAGVHRIYGITIARAVLQIMKAPS